VLNSLLELLRAVCIDLRHSRDADSPSKSVINVLAPEFSALITIFRSVGPVISTLSLAPANSAISEQSGHHLFASFHILQRQRDSDSPTVLETWTRGCARPCWAFADMRRLRQEAKGFALRVRFVQRG